MEPQKNREEIKEKKNIKLIYTILNWEVRVNELKSNKIYRRSKKTTQGTSSKY